MANAKKTNTPDPVEALAQARALVGQREAEYTEIEGLEAALTARLGRGDTSVTAAELTEAANVVKRAELLLKAARNAIPAAELAASKYRARTNPLLANFLREVIEQHPFNFSLFEVPLQVVPERPETFSIPGAYLYQEEDGVYDYTTGRVTGMAMLLVAVPPVGLDIVRHAITAGLHQLVHETGQAYVQATAVLKPDHFILSVHMKDLEPPMPIIAEESRSTGRELVGQVTHRAAVKSKQYVLDPRTDRWANVHTVASREHAAEVVSQVREGDTVRRAVRTSFVLHGLNRNMDLLNLGKFLDEATSEISGAFSAGLGRVERVTVSGRTPVEVGDGQAKLMGLNVTAEFVLVSRAAA